MVRALTGAVLGLLLLNLAVRADIPSPDGRRARPQPGFQAAPLPVHTMVTLVVSQKGDGHTHLRLGRSLLKNLRAEGPSPRQVGFANTRQPAGATMIAGVALALAFVFSGFWLVRAKPRRMVAIPILVVTGFLAAGLIGCIGDRISVYETTSSLHLEDAGTLEGDALLEVDDKAEDVQIVIPREVIVELQEKASAPIDEAHPKGGR